MGKKSSKALVCLHAVDDLRSWIVKVRGGQVEVHILCSRCRKVLKGPDPRRFTKARATQRAAARRAYNARIKRAAPRR